MPISAQLFHICGNDANKPPAITVNIQYDMQQIQMDKLQHILHMDKINKRKKQPYNKKWTKSAYSKKFFQNHKAHYITTELQFLDP